MVLVIDLVVVSADVDECATTPDLCKNGYCVNGQGDYRCVCTQGYASTADGKRCIGKNSVLS